MMPDELAFLERERDVLQHDLVAEALVQARGFEEGHARPPSASQRRRAARPAPGAAGQRAARHACQMPAMPSGWNSTIAMNSRPYQSSQVSV